MRVEGHVAPFERVSDLGANNLRTLGLVYASGGPPSPPGESLSAEFRG